jgi:anaerobic selenocysteine-containing dehydrogenase
VAYFHSEHRNIPWMREIDPYPVLEINTRTASELGITDGEWVVIENDLGKYMRKARVTPTIHPKVVMAPHGWWPPELKGAEPNLYGIWRYNCNNCIPLDSPTTHGYGSGAYKTTLCRVRKMAEDEVWTDPQGRPLDEGSLLDEGSQLK